MILAEDSTWLALLLCEHFIAVSEKVICLALYFLRQQMNYETILYTTHNSESSLFAALNIWFVLGAARLVVVRLVGCFRRNGLAGC